MHRRLAVSVAHGYVAPIGQRGPGNHRAAIAKILRWWAHAGQRSQRGIAQLPTIGIGHRSLALVRLARPQFATATQGKNAGRAGGGFHHLAHGPNIIRADQRILPGQRGWVAGIVDQRGPQVTTAVGHAGQQQRIIRRWGIGVKTTGIDTVFGVPVVAIGGQATTPSSIGNHSFLQIGHGLPRCLCHFAIQFFQVSRDQLAAGELHAVARKVARRMAVREGGLHVGRWHPSSLAGPADQLVLLLLVHAHMIEFQPNNGWGVTSKRGQGQGITIERAVNAGGALVAGRAPHGVIDVGRRGDLDPGNTDL